MGGWGDRVKRKIGRLGDREMGRSENQ